MIAPLLGILFARIVPKGIIGIILVSIVLSFIAIGKKSMSTLLIVFIIPVILALFLTPECITPLHSRNREYYGSTLNICNIVPSIHTYIPIIRIMGEMIFIGSAIILSGTTIIRILLLILGITLILIEMMFVHPVPLLEREYTQWKLQTTPLQ
jgi:hypothetical protein